jgi:hypothetical protein
MGTDKDDRLWPGDDGAFFSRVRAAIDDIRREEPEERVLERVVARALAIPSLCDVPVPDAPPGARRAGNSTKPLDSRPRRWDRITHWTGGLSMRQRIALGGAGGAAVLAVVLLWTGTAAKRASAMEKMAASIRHAKSCTATAIWETSLVRDPAKPPLTSKSVSKIYWLAPCSVRVDTNEQRYNETYIFGPDSSETKEWRTTDIFPAGKPAIHLDHNLKTFQRLPARSGHVSPLAMVEKLGEFSGQADRELGIKEISGKRALGFQVNSKKIDPDAPPGSVEIWIDTESHLPALIRYEMMADGKPHTARFQDFQWNIDLAPKLFEATPSQGYTDATPKPPLLQEQVRYITEALETYRQLSGGHYPRVKMVYGDVTRDEMNKMGGIAHPPTPEQVRSDNYVKIMRATRGFAWLNSILRDNPDAAYHGKSVEPKDKDKVLLRWKVDDGQYEAIFGDLRSATVAAERLRALERD